MTIELETLGHGEFSLHGHADLTNVARLLEQGRELFFGLDEVTIDLEQADCGNTAGLALLLEWSTWCQLSGIKLTYTRAPDDFLDMVKINGVAELLSFSRPNNRNLSRRTGN